MAGLATSFGSGAMSNSMDDIAQFSRAILVIGSNTTEAHPVFGTMLRRAVRTRGAQLVVADPRRIDLVDFAVLHLQLKPGTDIALINGLMHIILEKRLGGQAIHRRTDRGLRSIPGGDRAISTGEGG